MPELSTLSSIISSVELNSAALFSDSALQGYWRMESNWNDSSPNGYNLTPTNSPTFITGKFGNAGNFVRASSQYASRAHGSVANIDSITGAQSWGFWYKPTVIQDYTVPMGRHSASGAIRRGFTVDNDTQNSISFEITGLTTNTVVTTPETSGLFVTGKWQFVVGVYTGSALKIYLNGVEVASVTASGTATGFSDGDFHLAHGGFSVFGYDDGASDDAFIFSKALTAAEIWTLYKEPLAYYQLENVNDSGAYGKTLTNNNAVAFNAAKFNNGADQGASNSNKTLNILSNLGIAGNGDFSISFWIKLRSEIASSTWTLVSHHSNTTADRYFDVNYEYNGGAQRLYVDAAGNNTNRYSVVLGTSAFYHVVAVRDASNSYLYVNGVLQATNGLGSGVAGDNGFGIGGTAVTGVSPSSAIFDDVAIFSRPLSATEVLAIYSAGHAGDFLLFM